MLAEVVAAAAVLQGGAVAAPPPPSAAQVAAARAEGDALLQQAHAEALFVNETGGPGLPPTVLIRLRHRASGYLCMFDPGKAANRVDVYRSLTPGADVSCTTQTVTDARTLYLFRAPEKTNAELLAIAQLEVHAADPTLSLHAPLQPDAPLPAPPGMTLPEHLAASEASASKGVRIVLGRVGDWALEYRFAGPRWIADASPIVDPFWRMVVLEKGLHERLAAAAGPPSTPPPPARPLADLKAETDQLIARAGAGDLFENVTSAKLLEARHRPSNLTCTFAPGEAENEIQVFTSPVRGEDVGCTTREGPLFLSLFATRLPGPPSLQQAMAASLQALRTAHPDATPVTGTTLQASLPPRPGAAATPAHLTARFDYVDHGERAYSRLSVAMVNGWMVQERATAPVGQEMLADLLAETTLAVTLAKMVDQHPA